MGRGSLKGTRVIDSACYWLSSCWRFRLIVPLAARLGGGFTAGGARGRKFARVFETLPGETGKSLVIDAGRSSVVTGKSWENRTKADKSGQKRTFERGAEGVLSAFVRSISGSVRGMSWFCPVLSPPECRRAGPAVLGTEVILSHFVPKCPICAWGAIPPGKAPGPPIPKRYKYDRTHDRTMVTGRCRSWKGASVRLFQNNHNEIALGLLPGLACPAI